ncbi:MAG: 23S rRNA (adenine(2030)-N(6))-methyltransferase RlmJ [Pseudomonadota bacterium]|nr:23S rRNA (adenine(2030)-N(6))-methyltransferase RlmJ [Pseudomonadota bacterium]
MNYRHIFHAGNICDVVKHAALTLVLAELCKKTTSFFLLDTHAGAGLYDLEDSLAGKTNEAERGIRRLLAAPKIGELAGYYDALASFNREPDGQPPPVAGIRFYPGSPLLAASLMRAGDRLIACELLEEDVQNLKRHARRFPNIHVHHRNGYEAMGAFVPPAEKRGLVLIDPPYEDSQEFGSLTQATKSACRRWPHGVYLIWYPIKERPALWRFHEGLVESGLPRLLCAEFLYEEETRHDWLNGCGLIFINPPWQLDEKLRTVFSALHGALGAVQQGNDIRWLAGGNNAET